MFNSRTYKETQEIIEDLRYDLIQIESEIEELWECEHPDQFRINELGHSRNRIKQDIKELEFSL